MVSVVGYKHGLMTYSKEWINRQHIRYVLEYGVKYLGIYRINFKTIRSVILGLVGVPKSVDINAFEENLMIIATRDLYCRDKKTVLIPKNDWVAWRFFTKKIYGTKNQFTPDGEILIEIAPVVIPRIDQDTIDSYAGIDTETNLKDAFAIKWYDPDIWGN
jgi:hypothetical protein